MAPARHPGRTGGPPAAVRARRRRVAVGDRVEAVATTIAAGARQLPFDSQVDRVTAAHRGAPAPHVHVELAHA
jgi:hypothetical protein